jgi:alkylhydroperoxidase family enzyme
VDINSAVGRKAGLSDQKLLAAARHDLSADDLSRETLSSDNVSRDGQSRHGLFSRDELLVIELADAMSSTPSNISDELYARLREKFSEEQLLQLSAQLAFENYRARLNRVFDVGSEELFKPQTTRMTQT